MINKLRILINRLSSSKDGRVLTSNFSYLFILQISGYIFPLLTIPYLARVIGVDGFGKIAFAAAVVTWLRTISDWGFNYTATRDVARVKENEAEISKIFSNVLWARMLLAIVSFLILLIAIYFIPYLNENRNILLMTFLLVPGNIIFPEWFFQAMERMKFITIFNILSKAFFTILVFIFINNKEDYILQPLFISLGYIVSGIFSMYIIIFRWNVKIHYPILGDIIRTIKGSTDVFINNIMPNLYNTFSTVLLGFFGGTTANGLLDAGNKLVNIAQQFLSIFSKVFFPILSRKIHIHNLFSKISLMFSIGISLLLFLLAPFIISFFYTSEFNEAVLVLRITSVSIVFVSLSNIYGTNFLILKGYTKELRNITTVASLIGFALAFPLVYYYSFIGAAITITLTRVILGLSIMMKAKLLTKNPI